MRKQLLTIKRRICESLALTCVLLFVGISPIAALLDGVLGVIAIHLVRLLVIYIQLTTVEIKTCNKAYKQRKNTYETK